jgi:DMSO/TMAO reductase YedYZ molybdopterin-dependent catalytic subunit
MAIPGFCKWLSKWPGDGGQPRLSRRTLIGSAAAGLLCAQEGEVSNFDLSLLDESTVPAELFFIRDHFPAPKTSSAGWKLSVSGAVANPLEISYEELSEQARKILPVTIECAENPVGGGLVGHAEWTGVTLASILERARASSDAGFVRLSGADGFSRTISLAKALYPDTLIAYAMNGEKLPASHGHPLRAVIPGWYGMASIKWLQRVEVLISEDVFPDYVRRVRSLLSGTRPAGAIAEMHVKSAFARPLDGAILTGRRFIVRGAAWAGENRVHQVEVSTDGAKSWQTARLSAEPLRYTWVQWTHEWKIPGAGQYELAVHASDDADRRQPAGRAPDRADGYELNSWQTVRVTVR